MYSSFPPETDADIIIIGAGISGMSAAFYILEREPTLNVLILEARSRIGGRTLSLPLKIGKGKQMRTFDLGGQFISTLQVHLMDLIEKLNLELVEPLDKQGITIWNLEKDKIATPSESTFSNKITEERITLTEFFEMINEMSKVSFSNPHSIPDSDQLDTTTMETFITENLSSPTAQNFIRHVIRTSCGVEPSQITVLFYLAYCNATEGIENQFLTENGGAKETWIKGGADQICQRMASLIGREFIKTNDAVIEIIRDPFQVTIETEYNTYLCKYVIIAIPPKEILDIHFVPPLTTSRFSLLESIDMGHLIKFVVTYETAFWKEKGYSGDIISCGKEGGDGPIHGCYDITFKNWPALTGYIASIDCLDQPEESYKSKVLQQLAKYFGEEALQPLDYFEKCWLEEPYIYSCNMNCPGIGNMSTYSEIRRPIGRLFWAGTETATSWNGFMGGAAQAGYRAAIEVLYECRPQILTTQDILFIYSRQNKRRSRLIDTLTSYGTSYWKILLSGIGVIIAILYFRRRSQTQK